MPIPKQGTVQQDYIDHLKFDVITPNPAAGASFGWSEMENLAGHRSGAGNATPWSTPPVRQTPQGMQDTGTSSAVAATTITDAAKAWATNQWAGRLVKSFVGTNAMPTFGIVASNTATVITLTAAGWSNGTPTSATALYEILPDADLGAGKNGDANSGATVAYAATTLTDTSRSWPVNYWAGQRIVTATGKTAVVASNTATVITLTAAGWTGGTPAAAEAYNLNPGFLADNWWGILRQRGNSAAL
jgi:hypothetical protein